VSHDPPEIIIICCNDAQETFLIINEFLLLHPFALSFVSLETQSYFWMVLVYSLIFPWDGSNKEQACS